MRMRCKVISDAPDEYTNKAKELVKTHMLALLDDCPSGVRLKNTFDYELKGTEREKFAGKLLDKVIELDIVELAPIYSGGRSRARGHIFSVLPDKK